MYRNFFWHSIVEIEIKKIDAMLKFIKIVDDKSVNELEEKENIETLQL